MRVVIVAILLGFIVTTASADDIFERSCVPCHKEMNISLRKTFMNALLVYGGEENMKAALSYYFKSPREDTSVMDEEFLSRVGIKLPTTLSDNELDSALDIYWQKYTLMGKLE